MLNTARRLSSTLAAVLLASMGSIGSHFSNVGMPTRRTHAAPTPARKIKPPKRKGYRTTRAEGDYGRNLRNHFDDVKRTPAQRNAYTKTFARQA